MKIRIDKLHFYRKALSEYMRFMKITTFLLFLCLSHLYAGVSVSRSQNARLSLDMSNATVEEVIEKIEKETDFKFVFTDKAVDTSRKVDIHFSDGELKEVLDQLIKNTGIDYKIVGQLIVLSEKKFISSQQDGRKQISGKIVDESGESMIGVNVVEKGTSNGVISDIEGKFILFISENATLQFSYIGYVTQEIPVRNQTSINVVLREEAIGLDEVVAIGY
ncbi:MAG: carboxypeptidase-like regulatory domain-containing protein, partial [Tannerellaceae bacterium]|nr:carboxypeptidase-like regulatory domain-containing protein [Tannerellaceae bacterium]